MYIEHYLHSTLETIPLICPLRLWLPLAVEWSFQHLFPTPSVQPVLPGSRQQMRYPTSRVWEGARALDEQCRDAVSAGSDLGPPRARILPAPACIFTSGVKSPPRGFRRHRERRGEMKGEERRGEVKGEERVTEREGGTEGVDGRGMARKAFRLVKTSNRFPVVDCFPVILHPIPPSHSS